MYFCTEIEITASLRIYPFMTSKRNVTTKHHHRLTKKQRKQTITMTTVYSDVKQRIPKESELRQLKWIHRVAVTDTTTTLCSK